jgi:hypothetical protein
VIVVRALKSGILGWGAAAVLLAAALAGAPAAYAESGWWHLTSGTRPGYLKPGLARDEVQEIVTSPGEYGATPATVFELYVEGEAGGLEGVGFFATEPVAKEEGVPAVTAANIQAGLEKVYGKGNVQVTGGEPGSVPGAITPLIVTSVGEDAYQPISHKLKVFNETANGSASTRTAAVGRPDGEIYLTADNLGDTAINASPLSPVRITDILPPGLKAVGVQGTRPGDGWEENLLLGCSLGSQPSCTLESAVYPFLQLQIRIPVIVEPGALSGELNEASISGGGAPSESIRRPITVSGIPTPFGVESDELTPEEEHGVPATQAGIHPFQLTTTIALNQTADSAPLTSPKVVGSAAISPLVEPIELAKDVNFKWPPGLIGNPTPLPRCTDVQFLTDNLGGDENECPAQTAVGVASVTAETGKHVIGVATFTVPLFNLTPRVGEPARFGFEVPIAGLRVYIDTSIRTGSDYGITVNVNNISQTGALLDSEVTVWGVPGDLRHASQRGWACLYAFDKIPAGEGLPCEPVLEQHPVPFLQMPTSCTGPLSTSVESDSWAEPKPEGSEQSWAGLPMPAMDGCNRAPFNPTLIITPDGKAGSTATGLNVDVHNPQENTLNPAGLAEPDVKNITVTLPEGFAINPAGADGLEACSESLVGFTGFTPLQPGVQTPAFTDRLPGSNASGEPLLQGVNFCPDASKIGTFTVRTPLLPNPLTGAVYLATQDTNPFGSLIAMYIIAEDPVSGVLVKLAGEVHLDEATGQVVTTFPNTPQLPFEDAELHFFGGDRGPLATPSHCGTYTSTAVFAPWTGTAPAHLSSNVEVTSGPDHTPCPGAELPFKPTLTAGTTSIQAGGFSPFTMTMSREDGEQTLKSIELHMPPGMSGTLSTVKLCGEQQADEGTCPADTEIGETIVSVGVGGDPYSVKGGKVYITGPYKGAPFGLSIVNPAKAGPFDLGKVVVRAKVDVNPVTTALTITTDTEGPYKLPTILDGIPLEIRHVNVDINRQNFTFNPTNCSPMAITGKLGSTEGGTSSLSVPFQITNCAVLAFRPKLESSTGGRWTRQGGTNLNVKLSYPAGPYDANISRVKVELPKGLPSRLPTLQKACLASVFEANPAACPAASIIGHAHATTPILPVPLEGPAYFVSHGGEAFPSLVIVLQGYGVTVQLVGTTYISKTGVTSSTFKTVPDAPVGSFELDLPAGPYSALTGLGNLCKAKSLNMPTEFVGQNGAEIHTTTKIAVTGCGKAARAKHAKHRRAKRARKHGRRARKG